MHVALVEIGTPAQVRTEVGGGFGVGGGIGAGLEVGTRAKLSVVLLDTVTVWSAEL